MYLSRIALNEHRRDTMAALASPYKIHAAVESSFPPDESVKKRNLWRIDRLGNNIYLLVLSKQRPDFTHVVEQYGWPRSIQKWETKSYTSLIDQIKIGQKWQFRLRANPVHSVRQGDGIQENDDAKRGRVYAHVTVRQQEEWLLERAAKNGFALTESSFRVIHREVIRFRKKRRQVTLSIATYEGLLEISDVPLFICALTQGIGRAKAFGCGLLTIVRVTS